jgi:hypothetical protein
VTATSAGRDRLEQLLRTLRQGDLISLGAVTMVGAGRSAGAAAADVDVDDGQLWSITVDSEAGWYVVISQDCDVVRSPDDEPCIVVCPLVYITGSRWRQLRSGPYSPRQFPFPDDKGLRPDDDRWPAASLLYVSSVDKTALLHDSVQQLAPLTGPQRLSFGRWVARRYGRPAHDDLVERDVLSAAGARIRSLAKSFDKATNLTDMMRLVAATEEWYVEANDRNVKLHAVLTEASANAAGLWDNAKADWHTRRIEQAAKGLRNDLARRLPPGSGYALNVNVTSLDRVPASQYVSAWATWTLDSFDPLDDG